MRFERPFAEPALSEANVLRVTGGLAFIFPLEAEGMQFLLKLC